MTWAISTSDAPFAELRTLNTISALVGWSDVVFADFVILGLRFCAEQSGASTDPRSHLLVFSCDLTDPVIPFGRNSNALFGTQVQSKSGHNQTVSVI